MKTTAKRSDGWKTFENAAYAAEIFFKAFKRLDRLVHQRKRDERKCEQAMAQWVLYGYALKEALDLMPGEWDYSDIEITRAVAEGKATAQELKLQTAVRKAHEALIKGATIIDESGQQITPDPDQAYEVLGAVQDKEGKMYIKVRLVEGGE